jgi:condensation domain-containing protein
MAERIVVAFEGEGSGVGELTWGQRQIWQAMQDTGTSQSMGAVVPLDGKTVVDLAAELRFFMCRYESMRTRLRFDAEGKPWQEVSRSGEIAMEVFDADDDGDPAEVAEALALRWEETNFDYVNEWPMRMGVVRHRGVATHVVVMLCHLAADGAGVAVMMDELAQRDPDTGQAHTPVTAMQPRELALQQRTPAGQRQSDTAMRYWERMLRTMTPRRFGDCVDRREPRFWQVGFDSPAMYLAVQAIAARTTGDASPVLLAAFAVALARVTGNNPVVTQAIISNRFRPGLAEVVSPVNENGLYVVDVADCTFDEAVERARRASMTGSKYAYYDPAQLDELITRVGRERGEPIDLGCVFNDRRIAARQDPAGPPASQEEVEAALAHSTLVWQRPLPSFNERLMVSVNDVPDTVDILAEVDTHHLSPAALEVFLRGMEAVVVEAAFDPAASTRVASTLAVV